MEKVLTKNIRPDRTPPTLAEYEQSGGYEGLRRALKMSPREVQEVVIKSNLRGRGGAGFNAGRKWAFMPMGPRPGGRNTSSSTPTRWSPAR